MQRGVMRGGVENGRKTSVCPLLVSAHGHVAGMKKYTAKLSVSVAKLLTNDVICCKIRTY